MQTLEKEKSLMQLEYIQLKEEYRASQTSKGEVEKANEDLQT